MFLQGQSRAKSPERPAKQGEKGAKGSRRVWKELLSAISYRLHRRRQAYKKRPSVQSVPPQLLQRPMRAGSAVMNLPLYSS